MTPLPIKAVAGKSKAIGNPNKPAKLEIKNLPIKNPVDEIIASRVSARVVGSPGMPPATET